MGKAAKAYVTIGGQEFPFQSHKAAGRFRQGIDGALAVARAEGQREGLEEAALWHDKRETANNGAAEKWDGHPGYRSDCYKRADVHKESAATLRALKDKEPDNAE